MSKAENAARARARIAASPKDSQLAALLTSDLFVDLTGFLVCFQVWLLRGAL